VAEQPDAMMQAAERVHTVLQELLNEGAIAPEDAKGGLVVRWVIYLDIKGPDGGDFYTLLPSPDSTRRDNVDLTMRGAVTELVDWTAAAVVEQMREAD
jgi:hypothetical protein